MRSLVLFWMCALVFVLLVKSEEQQVMLCGRELARARVLLCFGSEYMDQKRSSNSMTDESEDKSWLWGGRRDALGFRWARHKRGLVDECCLKSCTTEVIRTYC